MMIPDGYNINIAKKTDKYPNGKFFGRLEMTDVATADKAMERLMELRSIFPEDYILTLQHVTCRGQNIAEA